MVYWRAAADCCQHGPGLAPRRAEARLNIADALRQRARALKQQTYALYLAARHPRTPWYAKLLVAPVLGYLDELILLPLGIALALRMIPPSVLAECRARAHQVLESGEPVSRTAAVVIVAIWIGIAAALGAWLYRALFP